MRFAFIDWICEYRELCVIVHVFFLWSFMVSFFVHCAFSFRLPLSSTSIILTLFTSVFSYVMMTHSCPGATGQALQVRLVTPFIPPVGFDPGFLG